MLAEVLESGSGVISQAIAGLGGIGKTELALRHAWALRDRYRLVWWITAADSAGIEAGLAALAYRLLPVLQTTTTPAEAAEWAIGWLQIYPRGLLILDNVEDPGAIYHLLGALVETHVLVTTRRDLRWQRLGLTPVRLGVLTKGAAANLLVELTGDSDWDAARALANDLGCLPLALDQAGAYIAETRITLARYRQILAADPGRMLITPADGTTTDRVVARVWDLTRTAIQTRRPLAGWLLDILAWLGPDLLPRDVLDQAADNEDDTSEALAMLSSYSMITLTADTISVHRLVQAVARLNQPMPSTTVADSPDDTRIQPGSQPAVEAVRLLETAIPDGNPTDAVATWPRWRALLPHVDAVITAVPACAVGPNLAQLLVRSGTYQRGQGQYEAAIAKHETAVALLVAMCGPGSLETLAARNDLGLTYHTAGRTTEAIASFEALLIDSERLLDHNDRMTLTFGHNLGLAYQAAGRALDAIPLYEAILATRVRILGPDHPSTLTTRHNLAGAYAEADRTDDAIPLYESTLEDRERILGPEALETLLTRSNLAVAYVDSGHISQGITLQRIVRDVSERLLGSDHPDTLSAVHNLGHVYNVAGRVTEAAALFEAALAGRERLLGRDHPETLLTRANLATIHLHSGRTSQAITMLEAVLTDSGKSLQPERPGTVAARHSLAVAYQTDGRVTEAIKVFEAVLAARERHVGQDHRDTLRTRESLADAYYKAGRMAEAIATFEAVIGTRKRLLNPSDPDTLILRNNLAAAYVAAGRITEAIATFEAVLAESKRLLGPDHPNTVGSSHNLAAARREANRNAHRPAGRGRSS